MIHKKKMRKSLKRIFPLLLVIFLITQFFVVIKVSAAEFIATQKTSTSSNKIDPQLQVVGTKIYYVWEELDRECKCSQIWTAEMNIDSTGWKAIKRTTSGYTKWNPQLQVVGSKIYYVWSEDDGVNIQIWTAEMNIDGTGWMAKKRTTNRDDNYNPQLQVVGSKIYYVWVMYPADVIAGKIWTAEMNIDSTGWKATERTGAVVKGTEPQFQVIGSKIYYVWSEDDGVNIQIWTAEMNIDGTGWMATKRTTDPGFKYDPQLQVVGNKIYYVLTERDGTGYSQIWTGEMSLETPTIGVKDEDILKQIVEVLTKLIQLYNQLIEILSR